MKKLVIAVVGLVFTANVVSAQGGWAGEERNKRKYKDAEQQDGRAYDFEVNGFARDKSERDVSERDKDDYILNGFDNNAEEKAEKKANKVTRSDKRVLKGRKARADRYKDIEVLILDLNLAKIQKPVFRGIMQEHKADVTGILADQTKTSAEKNIALKQVYALRDKRLQETLSDTQFRKWVKIRDENEFVFIDKPEDY
jgi:hypothetical protein